MVAAVEAIRDKALGEVQRAGNKMALEISEVGELAKDQAQGLLAAALDYAELRHEAATLGEYVIVAQTLRYSDPDRWRALSREVIRHLLGGVALWTQGEGHDQTLPPPYMVRGFVPSWSRVRLSDLLIWALSGGFTQEERAALNTGR